MKDANLQTVPQHPSLRAERQSFAQESRRVRSPLRGFAGMLCTAFFIIVCAEAALAIPLNDYHEHVRRAIITLGSIGTTMQDEEYSFERERSVEAAAIREVRRLLPADETIEWQGGNLRVDNSWLKEALDNYERLPAGDPRRVEQAARIAERLQAIDERLSETERAGAKTINKEEEKARLAAILRRDEYNRQAPEGNAITRILKRIREWFRSLFPRREVTDAPQRESRAVNSTAQIIVILLSLAVIIFIASRFLPRFLRRDMRKRKPKKRGPRVVLGEQLSADESSADLLAEAERLAREGHLRAAIRKGYIALLCELHDRKLVRLEQHKTNRDYLRAVQSNQTLYEEMKPMTASFENHWYGFTDPTESDWQDFRTRYKKAIQQ
ncbi:MAG: DUF4129 domain-containing protein [Pyrinomonadaceae bacterium]|nr:DUF4129 domain-containing protein [Pyrinomonadaceae bacterium]